MSVQRVSSSFRQALWLAAAGVMWLACRDVARQAPVEQVTPAAPPASTERVARAWSSAASRGEGAPEPDPLDDLAPPDQPVQRLAFSRDRLAWLPSDVLWVFEIEPFRVVTQFRVSDARNVVALTGGGFLIAGREHVQRLSGLERRPESFPRAPRLGPTTIIPSRHESEQFWLYYAGIPRVPRFDLGAPPLVASLPMLDWTELYAFDHQALLGLGDGSFVYTTNDGLRRIDVEGRPEHLPDAELRGRVWALGRDERLDRVWAATERHLYLLHVREHVDTLRRFELPPHPVALAAEAGTVAVLSVESREREALRLRVDVYVDGIAPSRVLRLVAHAPAANDAGAPPRFEPELELSSADGLFAVNAYGLQVFDYRRSVRKYPEDDGAQKLAPRAQ